ncbi:MAG TPA: Ig-like domain-containing protein [Acidobacteriota bacterium]|nr:Ig-like domain-containing protein [Acidobacteriota bacterium]
MTRARSAAALAACAAVASLLGCARSLPPPGGPVDATPPSVLATSPADSSLRVPRDGTVELLFSEGMDRASVRDNVRLFPPAGRPGYDWSGRRFRVTWGESLRAGTTYQVFLSGRARDLRGVLMGRPSLIRFSTGDSIAPGAITGVLRAKTLTRQGVPILLFPDLLGARPDTSYAFEPAYQAETDTAGVYAFAGLPLDEGFTVHAFYDRNGDSYFDGEQDVLASYGEAVRLTPGRALADSINLTAVDPRAPGILSGSIVTPDSTARFRIEIRAAADSSVVAKTERLGPGTFAVRVPAGSYRVSARRLATVFRPARPGAVAPAAPVMTEAYTILDPVVAVGPEEERGPFVLTFPPGAAAAPEAPPPPEPQEDSR